MLSEGNRTLVERVLPVFQATWSKYDREAIGTIHEKHIEALLRQIPEPIGISFESSYTHVRARGDFLRLHKVGDQVGFTDVLCGLVAIWLTEEGQTVDSDIAFQMNKLSASITINSASRRWIQNRAVRKSKRYLSEEIEREKMRREDTRLTDILKKATTRIGKRKSQPRMMLKLQQAHQLQTEEGNQSQQTQEEQLQTQKQTEEQTQTEEEKQAQSQQKQTQEQQLQLECHRLLSSQGSGHRLSPILSIGSDTDNSSSMTETKGWMYKAQSLKSPHSKVELQKIERFLGDRYEEL